MFKFFIGIFVFLVIPGMVLSQQTEEKKLFQKIQHYKFVDFDKAEVKLSEKEYALYNLIMEYRAEHNLSEIPLSKALTFVAQTHVGDLTENYRINDRCNIHSWSKKGKWSACCYSKDHRKAECMWDKPRELTSYKGDGFEIAFWSLWSPTAESTLEHWKKSAIHVPVLLNTGNWEKVEWKAIGIGIYKDYAVVWFGKIADLDGSPVLPLKSGKKK